MLAIEIVLWYNGWAEQRKRNRIEYRDTLYLLKIKPIMYLALSYDHRIIDGKDSVSFLKTVKENLEDPRRLFLNI